MSNEIEFERVGRADHGAYLCIASNGIPPARSRRISLSVLCKYILSGFLFNIHHIYTCRYWIKFESKNCNRPIQYNMDHPLGFFTIFKTPSSELTVVSTNVLVMFRICFKNTLYMKTYFWKSINWNKYFEFQTLLRFTCTFRWQKLQSASEFIWIAPQEEIQHQTLLGIEGTQKLWRVKFFYYLHFPLLFAQYFWF